MVGRGGAVDRLCLSVVVGGPDVLHVDDGQRHPLGIAQGEAVPVPEPPGQVLGDVEGDGDRPERPVGEPHRGADRGPALLPEESAQGREAAGGQQLEVAELAGGQVPARQPGRLPA